MKVTALSVMHSLSLSIEVNGYCTDLGRFSHRNGSLVSSLHMLRAGSLNS